MRRSRQTAQKPSGSAERYASVAKASNLRQAAEEEVLDDVEETIDF